ncbi:Cystathionine gamma-synthase/O-acetylhomoserine (thiol)-lyase [Bhargavaea cecembensis DSE10]|uniref:Cystathionine gamma-synthase/O-acetylhomoserine (Thiol)-lyase n=1 Tax=Bhargavaea cecembensis DSE10 TaxID=1235279 RepID=M7P5D3_9BACL|nr:methionine biosynthesis PLP-dependent protein [Bhargavaea cecembensis]EMR05729.1 Cystathionine gamma-synthase/O-acetylhomoserine (thiol)-lyase [Bhargavaea cecembensis DSE10]
MTTRKTATLLAQLGNRTDPRTGAVNPPIYLSTAYGHPGLGQSTGFDYSRTKNPTRSLLEEGFAELEEGDAAFACSSGMAAIGLVLSLFRPGDGILAPEDLYGGTYRLLEHYRKQYGIPVDYRTFSNPDEVEQAITGTTKALFIESPTNPLMQEINIEAYATIAKKHGLLLIVDNTFYTPILQKPIALGADIVIHSATKYIGGHNDVLAGLVVAKGETLCEQLAAHHNAEGAVLSPFDSWLVIRGLKTLPLRMKQHEANAREIAAYLETEPAVSQVLYPGRGGMLSFRTADPGIVAPLLEALHLILFAESLGGVESFITYPSTQTHADIPLEERTRRGIDQSLLRLSVGIEDAEDIIEDLKQAFRIALAKAGQPSV